MFSIPGYSKWHSGPGREGGILSDLETESSSLPFWLWRLLRCLSQFFLKRSRLWSGLSFIRRSLSRSLPFCKRIILCSGVSFSRLIRSRSLFLNSLNCLWSGVSLRNRSTLASGVSFIRLTRCRSRFFCNLNCLCSAVSFCLRALSRSLPFCSSSFRDSSARIQWL